MCLREGLIVEGMAVADLSVAALIMQLEDALLEKGTLLGRAQPVPPGLEYRIFLYKAEAYRRMMM